MAGDSLQKPAFAPSSSRSTGRERDLTPPSNFELFTKEEKEIVVQNETVKEGKKDLDAIGNIIWHIATILCFKHREPLDKTIDAETRELYEVGHLVLYIFDIGRPGKMRRTRVLQVRDNTKGRIAKAAQNSQNPTDGAVILEMRRGFSREHIDLVEKGVLKVEKEIDYWC